MTQLLDYLSAVMNSMSVKFAITDTETVYCKIKRMPGYIYAPNVIGSILYESIMYSGEIMLNIIGLVYRKNPASLEEQVVFDQMYKADEFKYEDIVVELWILNDVKSYIEISVPSSIIKLTSQEPTGTAYVNYATTAPVQKIDRRHTDG